MTSALSPWARDVTQVRHLERRANADGDVSQESLEEIAAGVSSATLQRAQKAPRRRPAPLHGQGHPTDDVLRPSGGAQVEHRVLDGGAGWRPDRSAAGAGPLSDELVTVARGGPLRVRHQDGDDSWIVVGQPVEPSRGEASYAGVVTAQQRSRPGTCDERRLEVRREEDAALQTTPVALVEQPRDDSR